MGGAVAWAGTGAGNAEKKSPPEAVEWGGAGKGPRAGVFRGPVRPVTNSKQDCDVAWRYDEYQAPDDKAKAQVYQEMILEENEVLEQERVAILADWWQYYPNQFSDNGLPLGNPRTPIEVDSPPSSRV